MTRDISQYKFIEKLKQLNFVEAIWLFGSRARGDNQERADIDLAIICPSANDEDWLQVIDIIENADTLLKIDCVRAEEGRISNELWQNILKCCMSKTQAKFEKALASLAAIYMKIPQADRADIDATIQL